MNQAAENVPLTTNGFPPVVTDAAIPPRNITHFPAIKISGGLHSLKNLPEIILAPSSGVEVSIISFASIAIQMPCSTGPT